MLLTPVVALADLGRTALFGNAHVDLAGEAETRTLATAATLNGPDFSLAFAAGQPAVDALEAILTLRGASTLPIVLPALNVRIPLQVEGLFCVFKGIDKIVAAIPAGGKEDGIQLNESVLEIVIGNDSWRASLRHRDAADMERPLGTIHVRSLAFDVKELQLAETGVTRCDAAVQTGRAPIGRHQIEVSTGRLSMQGSRIEATVEAQMHVEGFVNSRVELTINASRGSDAELWKFHAYARTPSNKVWTDPSGFLQFERIALSLAITDTGANLSTQVTASGRVTFLAKDLDASAREWLGELFAGLSADFEGEELHPWGAGPTLQFRPLNGIRIKALDVFDMVIPEVAFGQAGLTLSKLTLAVNVGGAAIRASLDAIHVSLGSHPSLNLGAKTNGKHANPLILDVELSVPAGIKADGKLTYHESGDLQALHGTARFSSPTLPGVDVMFQIGRKKFSSESDWEPLFLLYAESPALIPMFPGVVIQRIGLGAGVNYKIEGVTGLSLVQAQERVRQGGLPDVANEKSWVPSRGEFTLAARAFAAPSTTGNDTQPELYIADLTLILASDFQLASTLKVWFQTSVRDAASARFQAQPAVVGLATFDGNQPSLQLVAMTKTDALSSLGEQNPVGRLLTLSIPEARLAFEAKRSGMALVIGPNRIDGQVGPLHFSNESLLAIRSAESNVYVLYRNALNARFHVPARSDFGMVSLTASVSAEFAANLLMWGGFTGNALTVYGHGAASFVVDVSLHVRIGFRIEIEIPFGEIVIEYHQDWDFSLRVHIDLDFEMSLSTVDAPGLRGTAGLNVNVVGISATIPFSLTVAPERVAEARNYYDTYIHRDLQALGA